MLAVHEPLNEALALTLIVAADWPLRLIIALFPVELVNVVLASACNVWVSTPFVELD